MDGLENINKIPVNTNPAQVVKNVKALYFGMDSIINTHKIDKGMLKRIFLQAIKLSNYG